MPALPSSSGRAIWCLLVAFNSAVTLSSPKANLCEMVWWALRIASASLWGIMGKMSVIEQAGVLGAVKDLFL